MTEKEKMLSGMVYSAVDGQLLEELNAVKEVIHRYNALSPADNAGRLEILKGLLGHIADDEIIINQPFYCDYGKQISVGKRFFANFHFTVLDEAKVIIGDDCFIGPNVSIYTACHSTDPIKGTPATSGRSLSPSAITYGSAAASLFFLESPSATT